MKATVVAIYTLYIAVILVMLWGWLGNIIWLLKGGAESTVDIVVGAIGTFIPFVGALHYYLIL